MFAMLTKLLFWNKFMTTLTPEFVKEVYDLLRAGNVDEYLERFVHDHVIWTITGSNVLSGTYHSKADFINQAIKRLKNSLSPEGIKWDIHNLFIDHEQSTVIVEMSSIATAKLGHPYHNQYVWVQKFDAGKIIETRVYYDDVLVNKTMI